MEFNLGVLLWILFTVAVLLEEVYIFFHAVIVCNELEAARC